MGALFGKDIEDVKNYLASIKMNAAYIGDEMQLPKDVREALREITAAVNKSVKILDAGDRK